jgi:glycosyltransferase involved in cell wall biosynthesis
MKKKILLKGPLLTRSGYGEQARFALRSLRSKEDTFDIFIQPIQWGKTSWTIENDEEREWIDKTIEKTIAFIQQGGQFDMSLQVTIPNEWQKIAPVNIGYTAGIETTKVAPVWIQKANEVVDKTIVVSNHSKSVFYNTKLQMIDRSTGNRLDYELQNPVVAVNYPVKHYDELPELNLDVSTNFNFLTVAQFGPRKNLPNTIKWFVEEFADNEDVGLIIKSNIAKNCYMDRTQLLNDLKGFLRQLPAHKCKIYLLHGDMSDEEMHALYRHPKTSALLTLAHGEGFGLPVFEAAYSGMPVVSTVWSGQLDFLVDEQGQERFYNVAFDMQPVQQEVVWKDVLIAESMWAYPRETSAKEQMRQCYNDIINNVEGTHAFGACDYANELCERFAPEKMYAEFCDNVYKITPEEKEWLKTLSEIEII